MSFAFRSFLASLAFTTAVIVAAISLPASLLPPGGIDGDHWNRMTNLTTSSGGQGQRRPNRPVSVRAAEPPRQFVTPNIPWKVLPEELSQLDADIVRNIAGELTDGFLSRLLSRDHFAVRRRLEELLQKHSSLSYATVVMLAPERRRRLAEDIVRAELAAVAVASTEAPDARPGLPEAVAMAPAPSRRRYVKPTRRERESGQPEGRSASGR